MEVVIIGAGVSGLSCAQELTRSGHAVTVYERGRSVGGRCSTWRVEGGHLIDYGVTYYHGESETFLQALRNVEGTRIDGWPFEIEGNGIPCQPHSLSPRAWRLAFTDGVNRFPKHLARNIVVKTGYKADRLETTSAGLRVYFEGGEELTTRNAILAMPSEQIKPLIEPLSYGSDEARGVAHLISTLHSVPSLTVLATYQPEVGRAVSDPMWDIYLPDSSDIVQLISRESAKRPCVHGEAFVIQARVGWSSRHIDEKPKDWSANIIAETARLAGDWLGKPVWTRAHRWKFSRTDIGGELVSPILVHTGEFRLGLAGESFYRGAGVEAAYNSGIAVARRMMD